MKQIKKTLVLLALASAWVVTNPVRAGARAECNVCVTSCPQSITLFCESYTCGTVSATCAEQTCNHYWDHKVVCPQPE